MEQVDYEGLVPEDVVTFDLSCPWNRSIMMDLFLRMWLP